MNDAAKPYDGRAVASLIVQNHQGCVCVCVRTHVHAHMWPKRRSEKSLAQSDLAFSVILFWLVEQSLFLVYVSNLGFLLSFWCEECDTAFKVIVS